LYARARVMGSYPEIVAKPNICVTEMPSNAVAVLLLSGRDQPSFRSGGHPAVKPTAPLSGQHPHDARSSGGLGAAPRSEFALQRQPSVRQAALERLPTPMPFTTRSFRACAPGSRTANNGVHQARSQNYVKPHDARTRVHVAKVAPDSTCRTE
jgi:hypothetical protein